MTHGGELVEAVKQNPINSALLEGLPALGLNQCYLTAGCLFQALWNHRSGLPASAMVKDYDVFYFDDSDLSWDAEDAIIQRVQSRFLHLGVPIEVKNQARVHLWYEQRFGFPCPKLSSATEGIDRYLILCAQVGIEVRTGCLYAPSGLDELRKGVLRMNPLNPVPSLFLEKARSFQSRWPWLTIVEPHTETARLQVG